MVILLTGGTGYLGSKLTKLLCDSNHKVILLKRQSSCIKRLKKISHNLVYYDVENCDCSKPFNDFSHIDIIIHAATDYGRNSKTEEVLESNVTFPVNLLVNAIKFNSSCFINTDTYFNTESPICSYLDKYATSKKLFLEESRKLALNSSIKYINMRLEHVYGAGDSNSKFVNWLFNNLIINQKELNLTLGEQMRDFIYIDDVSRAYKNMIYNINKFKKGYTNIPVGSGVPISIKEFVLNAKNFLKSDTILKFGAIDYRKNEIFMSCADTEILNGLGWNCQFSLKEGFIKMKEYHINTKN